MKPLAIAKGISDVPWHRDCNLGRHAYGCCSTTIGISVTDGGEGRGQLRVVPGSHRLLMPSSVARHRRGLAARPAAAHPQGRPHRAPVVHPARGPAPVTDERIVMYTGFGLEGRDGTATRGS